MRLLSFRAPRRNFPDKPSLHRRLPLGCNGCRYGKYRFFECFGMVRIDSRSLLPAVACPLRFLNSHKKISRRPDIFILKNGNFRKFSEICRNPDFSILKGISMKIEKSCFRNISKFCQIFVFFRLHPPGGAPSPCRAGSSRLIFRTVLSSISIQKYKLFIVKSPLSW